MVWSIARPMSRSVATRTAVQNSTRYRSRRIACLLDSCRDGAVVECCGHNVQRYRDDGDDDCDHLVTSSASAAACRMCRAIAAVASVRVDCRCLRRAIVGCTRLPRSSVTGAVEKCLRSAF